MRAGDCDMMFGVNNMYSSSRLQEVSLNLFVVIQTNSFLVIITQTYLTLFQKWEKTTS